MMTTPENRQRIDELFRRALQRDPDEREAYLDEACGNNAELRAQVETLLKHDERAEQAGFLENPAAEAAESPMLSGTKPPKEGDEDGILNVSAAVAETHLLEAGDSVDSHHTAKESSNQLERIGRYPVNSLLGTGAFGKVYLAHDDKLDRLVAIKVPNPHRISRSEDVEAYHIEARIVAGLDHPNIVPVYDVGQTDDGSCFVVSKFIEGADLGKKIKEARPPHLESARMVATIAEALHYAHKQGLVHRDIKPANILLDRSGKPYLADFGLAIREDDFSEGEGLAGTVPYMSPEQASGEDHRLDGRSDIFSLGVVLYEMLTGQRPFRGRGTLDVLRAVMTFEPRPPRQRDDGIPRELERICLKALSKRIVDRYTTAKDMAEDLQHFLSLPEAKATSATMKRTAGVPAGTEMKTAESDHVQVKIIPKGLRSFDAHDADFFLELLPGPRDRDGLPDSIRFWKTRIEETDPDETFSVGLIYGPSGCGKSSLVKAGLLPHLSDQVDAVYVEATSDETETRLLGGLRKKYPALPNKLGLKETLSALRRGQGIPVGKKLLIVLDQFEQWLHANREENETELARALRQCDGQQVQCVLMVRDDFWMAVTRFMQQLEVRLFEGENSQAVDLFDLRHARNVLSLFGKAFGPLPQSVGEWSDDQDAFLDQATTGLAEEGKVVCVRLALFAEMVKGKPWAQATLKEVGGTKGVGVTFLEETFSAPTAPFEHRRHQKAARAVLKALLPESGSDIRGQMRSQKELLDASGCASRPRDFASLRHILDAELRLITPTDPAADADESESTGSVTTGEKYYQLTHDYLVPSLREWLTRKQKESRRGRAELRLAERSALWNARAENRRLPSLWEWLSISTLTDKNDWTEPQRKMMRKAGRRYVLRSGIVATLFVLLGLAALSLSQAAKNRQNAAEASRLVEGLLNADTSRVAAIIEQLEPYRHWADPELERAFSESADNSNAKLHAALALLPVDEVKLDYLGQRLLSVTPVQFQHVRDLLKNQKWHLIREYWGIAGDHWQGEPRRFQAACALATFDPDNERWRDEKFCRFVAGHLVNVQPSELVPWRDALRPVKGRLVDSLAAIYRDQTRSEQARSFATDTLAEYLSQNPDGLFDLLADAAERQFQPIYRKLSAHPRRGFELAHAEIAESPGRDASEEDKETLARRQANAAVMLLRRPSLERVRPPDEDASEEDTELSLRHRVIAWQTLLRMNSGERVWSLLRQSPDPRVRSYIIHWLGPRGADPHALLGRIENETDITIKRALLLCLGEFDESRLPLALRSELSNTLLSLYQNDPDAGLHAAAEWLLRKWGKSEQLAAIDKELQQSEVQLRANQDDQRQWYVNTQGQTFVILEAGEFLMGSPESELGRRSRETTFHTRRIGRRFAIAAKEVTKADFSRFQQEHPEIERMDTPRYVRTEHSPYLASTWYEAAAYCQWLSEKEGIASDQWCYEPNEDGEFAAGMKAKQNFIELSGYRLPTEAEWEFACRAGTETSRYFGGSETLLPKYAWCRENAHDRTWPVGTLKPNDFGLFDMLGNVTEWCHNKLEDYPATDESSTVDKGDHETISDSDQRVLRGGSFYNDLTDLRSAYRESIRPTDRYWNFIGFRPARSYP